MSVCVRYSAIFRKNEQVPQIIQKAAAHIDFTEVHPIIKDRNTTATSIHVAILNVQIGSCFTLPMSVRSASSGRSLAQGFGLVFTCCKKISNPLTDLKTMFHDVQLFCQSTLMFCRVRAFTWLGKSSFC